MAYFIDINALTFNNVCNRDRVNFCTYANKQTLNNGKCKRNLDDKGSSLPFNRVYRNASLDIVYHCLYNIKAYSTTRNIRNLIGSREAWLHNKLVCILICNNLVRVNKSVFNSLLTNLFYINSGTIIFYFDYNEVSFIRCLKEYSTSFWFTCSPTNLWSFNTMINRVSYTVHDWIEQIFYN